MEHRQRRIAHLFLVAISLYPNAKGLTTEEAQLPRDSTELGVLARGRWSLTEGTPEGAARI
jgi:hypothetical protein